ncbi:MAG: HoxN/HupN/NixA family nickel/cobalt transporter [Nitrososphaerales archaeon]
MAAAEAGSSIDVSAREKVTIGLIYAGIVIVTILAFTASVIIGRTSVALAGLGAVAYVFGLRHGVDADHIAAIDNTTRKLIQEGKRSPTVGTWFSLGHSTIVVGLIIGLVIATRSIAAKIPALQSGGAVVGTLVSGVFLFLIGLLNSIIVFGVYRVFKQLRQGELNQTELEEYLNKRGFMNRFFRPLFKMISAPWQIYPIGVLFGLGFDTASEVALIAISVGVGVSTSIPIYYILVLPLMFTCGMVLVDTTDGVTMRLAYGWAFLNPVRKVFYNLTVTVISVLVAFVIGGIEVLQVLSTELNLSGGFWDWLDGLNFETIGYGIAAIFATAWVVSVIVWKYKKYDQNPSPYATLTC